MSTPPSASRGVDATLPVAELFGIEEYRSEAMHVLGLLAPAIARHPTAFGGTLGNTLALIHAPAAVAFAADLADQRTRALLAELARE